MCDSYYEPAAVWNETTPRARKAHTCDAACGRPIAAGTVYVRIGSLFEGSWMTHRLHRECRDFLKYVQLDLCSSEAWGVESVQELALEHTQDPEIRRRYRLLLDALDGTSAVSLDALDVTP